MGDGVFVWILFVGTLVLVYIDEQQQQQEQEQEQQSHLNGNIHEQKVGHIIWGSQVTGKVTQLP